MNCLLLVFVLVALAVECKCGVQKYERLSYSCSNQYRYAMHQACIRKMEYSVRSKTLNPNVFTHYIRIAIDGCTVVKKKLDNYCDHRPERAQSSASETNNRNIETNMYGNVKNEPKPSNALPSGMTSSSKTKNENCKIKMTTFFYRNLLGWYTTKDKNCET